MGGPNGQLGVDESAADLRQLIGSLGPADNGSFRNHDGSSLDW
jgi:hypothetical protein